MKESAKRSLVRHPRTVILIVLLALLVVASLATAAWAQNQQIPGTQYQLGTLKIAKIITGDMPPGGPWTPDDFSLTITGPGGFTWTGSFPADGPIVLTDLIPGVYTVTENTTGASWIVTGEGSVTVRPGPGQTPLIITNEGVTTTTRWITTTTEKITTTTTQETTTTTAPETTTTTEEVTTSTAPATTATTAPPTTQAPESTTPIPSQVATGGGGTAGPGNGLYALIALAAALCAGLIMSGFRLAQRRK